MLKTNSSFICIVNTFHDKKRAEIVGCEKSDKNSIEKSTNINVFKLKR